MNKEYKLKNAIESKNFEEIIHLIEVEKTALARHHFVSAIKTEDLTFFKFIFSYLSEKEEDYKSDVTILLTFACKYGCFDIVKFLLEKGDYQFVSYSFALKEASKYGHLNIVKLLLKYPIFNPCLDNYSAIKEAARAGYCEIVKLLIEDERVDPSYGNNTLIQFASRYGCYPNIIKIFLNNTNVDPSGNRNASLYYAWDNKEYSVVKLLWGDKRVRNLLKKEDPNLYSEILEKITKNKVRDF